MVSSVKISHVLPLCCGLCIFVRGDLREPAYLYIREYEVRKNAHPILFCSAGPHRCCLPIFYFVVHAYALSGDFCSGTYMEIRTRSAQQVGLFGALVGNASNINEGVAW